MCRRGTSIVKNLKFLTLPRLIKSSSLSTNITVPTRVVVIGELPCITNTKFSIFFSMNRTGYFVNNCNSLIYPLYKFFLINSFNI